MKRNGTATHNNYGEEDEDVANFPSNEIRKRRNSFRQVPVRAFDAASLLSAATMSGLRRRRSLAFASAQASTPDPESLRLRALVCGA